jgi:hypothetical protein
MLWNRMWGSMNQNILINKLLCRAEFLAVKGELNNVQRCLDEIHNRLNGQPLPDKFTNRWNKLHKLGEAYVLETSKKDEAVF